MKFERDTKIAAIGILILFLLSFAGCGTMFGGAKGTGSLTTWAEQKLFDRTETVETNDVTINGVTIPITTTNVQFVPKPSLTGSINTAKAANGALNPTPTAPAINIALTALSGLLGIAAAWKTKRANQNSQASDVIIAAIETVSDPKVKEAISKAAREAGLSDFIHSKVKQITKGTK